MNVPLGTIFKLDRAKISDNINELNVIISQCNCCRARPLTNDLYSVIINLTILTKQKF